jgi:ribosomal protein S13
MPFFTTKTSLAPDPTLLTPAKDPKTEGKKTKVTLVSVASFFGIGAKQSPDTVDGISKKEARKFKNLKKQEVTDASTALANDIADSLRGVALL